MSLDNRAWSPRGFSAIGYARDRDPRVIPIPPHADTTPEERRALTKDLVAALNSYGDPHLTDTQRKVLDIVRGFLARHGRAPSLREGAALAGIAHGTFSDRLNDLEQMHLIALPGKGTRRPAGAIELTEGQPR